MNKRIIVSLLLLTASLLAGQINDKSPPPAKTAPDYSGMYTFLREGEFVQVTVEEAGRVTFPNFAVEVEHVGAVYPDYEIPPQQLADFGQEHGR